VAPTDAPSPARTLERFARHTVLVLGDVMLDRYVSGHVERISPEAPIPVLKVERHHSVIGGAGNVAANIAALGARPILIGAVGRDAAARELAEAAPGIILRLIEAADRPTTVKTRFVAKGHQLLRSDEEVSAALPPEAVDALLAVYREALAEADVVVLSDYAKGVLGEAVLRPAIELARAAGKKIVLDPKSADFTRYRGVTVLTPNALEAATASGIDTGSDEGAKAAARHARTATGAEAVLVTRSEKGMLLHAEDGDLMLPAIAREVADVSGAGDTVIAGLAAALAAGASFAEAVTLANTAAGIAVGKHGTATVSAAELAAALHMHEVLSTDHKIAGWEAAASQVATWHRQGLKIGFTNGCFDLIHPGHVRLLGLARQACDRLIVGLNSDESVRRLKGPERPVQNELARATVMASIGAVDLVVLFGEDTPLDLLQTLRPDLLVKGADYTIDQVVGADLVQGYGGKVVLVDLEPGHSTTGTIAKMRR
jgi:D-beta-D-heptose 7-phosphate kinase/D-beta-D-heptose 1-phosphate adenosyltransferase